MPDPTPFGRPEPTDAGLDIADRRAHERLPCPDPPPIRYLLRPSMRPGMALLSDFSAGGVGLLMRWRLPPGTTLLLQLPVVREQRPRLTHSRLARVAHSTPLPGHVWLVGCCLSPPLAGPELNWLRQLFTGTSG